MDVGESAMTSLRITGPVTLYETSEVREELRHALAERRPLRVDLETSGPWDLAGLQLLIAAVAAGVKAGVPVRLERVPRVCAEVADRAGLRDWLDGVTDSFV